MFDIYREVDLSYLGDGWADCYLKFRPASVKDVSSLTGLSSDNNEEETIESANRVLKILEDKFVSGKALRDGKTVDVKKEDLSDFPVDVLVKATEILGGVLEKKE